MGNQGGADRPAPSSGLQQHRADGSAVLQGESLDGIDRTKDLSEFGSRGREVERDLVTVADETMGAASQAVPVGLESVP